MKDRRLMVEDGSTLSQALGLKRRKIMIDSRQTFVCSNHSYQLAGLEKNLNSSLPFGQVALKFCLPWASLRLLFLRFSCQMTCLGPCPLGK